MANPQPPMSTTEFVAAVDPGIQKHFLDNMKLAESQLEKVFKVETTQLKTHTEQDFTGFRGLETVVEGAQYNEDAPIEGYATTYTQSKEGLAAPLTLEMSMFDLSGIAKAGEWGRQLSEAASYDVQEQAASQFNNGFDTDFTSYGDGKPFFSTDHTAIDSSLAAQSNASATGIDLTADNLNTANVAFRGQQNKRGKIIGRTPSVLLVPPALEMKALEITKSMNKAGTANNEANVHNMSEYSGGKHKVIVWIF